MTTTPPLISLLARQVQLDLSRGGTLARHLPGYEERPAQQAMAQLVVRAIEKGKHAVAEAGTGTGKSDAYLIPVVRSGETVVISTANKALQEQLFYKDIPFLQKHLKPFDAALVKGFANYVCLDRLEEERSTLLPTDASFDAVVQATQEEWNGDLETLRAPVSAATRARVAGDPDRCAWSKCQFFAACYQRKMREQAQRAQVIVVNHTLLLLDAAADNHILPEHAVSVLDECHAIEEEATRAFTDSVTARQIYTLLTLKAIEKYGQEPLLTSIWQQTERVWKRVEAQFGDRPGSTLVMADPDEEGLKLASLLKDLALYLTRLSPGFLTERDEILYKKLVKRVEHLAARVRQVFARDLGIETQAARQAKAPDEVVLVYVYYLERTGQSSFAVCAAPLEVAPFLQKHLFDKGPVISCSATIAVAASGGTPYREALLDCSQYRRRVGLEGGRLPIEELVLPLVFDYDQQARLYVPRDLPEPAYRGDLAEQYQEAIAQEMRRLVEASQGRAFLLFSSRRMLEWVYARIASQLAAYPLLKQGELSRQELVRQFRTQPGAVLFGLKSFWEGVDIVGEALSLVVIDKMPFEVPDDPVHEARVEQMKAAGEDWFNGYVLYGALLRLKQGVGRLIRTQTDRGVMAILDTRLRSKGYGRRVFASLPPARPTADLAEIRQFFEQH